MLGRHIKGYEDVTNIYRNHDFTTSSKIVNCSLGLEITKVTEVNFTASKFGINTIHTCKNIEVSVGEGDVR